ncbi:Fanconi anemia group A protein [Scophthalmus maximus]|uniref:Fanconi anemia group A protein n=1 Tax=Scophthalmus maximus TaxID=52904 RepID=UPI001FA8E43C|nr:Fanconi anemia group A protein [Scophthalmus maximus]
MSVSASCESVCRERSVSSLLAGRVVKRLKQDEGQRLQEAAIQLLEQQQNLSALLREVGNLDECNQSGELRTPAAPEGISSAVAGSLLACELRRQAARLGVPVATLSVKTTLERLTEITRPEGDEDERRELLTSPQRVQLCVLLESSRELLSQGDLCPKLLWQEYTRDQRSPELEVVYHLHRFSILSLQYILESDGGLRVLLVSQLKLLCSWTPPPEEEETRRVQLKVLSTVAGVLVGGGFEPSPEAAAPDRVTRRGRSFSPLCCSLLDEMLFWLLDTVDQSGTSQSAAAELWIQIFDASLCGVSASADALQSFFTHSLTQVLTYKPRLTVSDAVALQNEWTFAKASCLLTSLFRKLAVVFSVELLLRRLQQVLETHEVNWKHVLCFLSTLLVYNPCAAPSLRELLSRLLTSAFEGYDLEHMITAFLLARQGALEGAAVFSSYSDWFKMSFGGSSGFHAASKKSLVFLLKFLSDLVPFEPPQYLKFHILHPPFVPVKHRGLLMEYVSLAKTRLTDLRESVEDMGLYEDVSGAGGAPTQPQCQAAQDVEKAESLFESTGRISATVMEASIFRRPYFLKRFLPALLTPRVLPVKPDARMNLIEALRKADKIPAPQFSSYVESCQKHRRQDLGVVCVDTADGPLDVLTVQLQEFRTLVVDGNDGETMSQLSRISHTLSVVFPGRPDEFIQQTVVRVHLGAPLSPELHVKVVNLILRNFSQCLLDASRAKPPNKQNQWASRFVSMLLGNTQLISSLIHRLWDLLHNQGSSLTSAHVLGLAAFVVHLHASSSQGPLVQLDRPIVPPRPVPVGEALSAALTCSTRTNMIFCIRFCVAAVCYGMCRGDSLPQQQEYVLSSFYKKLLFLVPRLLPEARRTRQVGDERQEEQNLWGGVTHSSCTWRTAARRLWTDAAFQQLQETTPQYQLSFSDWLLHELRVQRSDDTLTDPERHEYQQWVCLELYWPRPEEQGGCGGDMRILCSRLLDAVMDQQLRSLEQLDERVSATGTCLPDIMSRLQEFVYEMEATSVCGRADVCEFLFEFVSRRCSGPTASSDTQSVGSELGLQHTLNTWNRVVLALPAPLFVQLKAEGGRTTLDCTRLMEHINQHQRKACSPAGSMSFHLTTHFLRGVLCASVSCGRPREEVDKAWTQISVHCPLLLTSTVHWWEHLSPVMSSLWTRLCDGDRLSQQLQLLTDCRHWANSVVNTNGPSPVAMPPAPVLLLASSLHRAWQGGGGGRGQSLGAALNMLRPERGTQNRQVLVFLLFLCVNDHLSTLLHPQDDSDQRSMTLFSDLLSVLVDSADWLLIFKSSEQGVYQSVTLVTTDECTRLMPWAFYSLLLQQGAELLHRAVLCPGFLHAAVLCYVRLLQLFLDGRTSVSTAEQQQHQRQSEPSQILSRAKSFLLRAISQTPPATLSSGQLRRLESQCADLDPEVAAALSMHLAAPSLSPEMDFL